MPRARVHRPIVAFAACAALLVSVATGCPTAVDPAARASKPAKAVIDENDPRVVRDGEDLYPAEVIERVETLERARDPLPAGTGTGKPDESNGVCRLFAPRMADPQCCAGEYGFDAELVRTTCGLEVYLGESFQGTCGYYFHRTGVDPLWARASFVAGANVAEAAATHDKKMQRVAKRPDFASKPVPGVEGALWSEHDGLHWAFVPGWDKVRMLSWSTETCSDAAIAEIIGAMVRAKQPPPGTPRVGLVPKART